MLELILKIREHTEAGSILEHMELFDELEAEVKKQDDYRCPSQITDDIMGTNPEFQKIFDKVTNNEDVNMIPGAKAVKNMYEVICNDYEKKNQSCNNCIYWMDDFCSNEVVCDIFSDIEIKGDWCDQWRSEDEVVRSDDG